MNTRKRALLILIFATTLLASFVIADHVYEQRRLRGWTLFDLSHEDTLFVEHSSFAEIQVDSAGRVWLYDTAECHDLCMYDGASWTHVPLPEGSPIHFLHEALDGGIWFQVGQSVVIIRDDQPQIYFEPSNVTLPNLNYIWAFAVDASDRLWIAWTWRTASDRYGPGVSIFEDGSMQTYTYENSRLAARGFLNSITVEGSGRAWVATSEGLTLLDAGSSTTYLPGNSGLLSGNVRFVKVNDVGDVWIASAGGLNLLHEGDWASFPDIRVVRPNFTFDGSGDPWAATDDLDIRHYDGRSWSTPTHRSGARGGCCFFTGALAVDARGRVWAATTQGIAVLDGQTATYITPATSGVQGTSVDQIAVGHDGRVWVATPLAVSVFDTVHHELFDPPPSLVFARSFLKRGLRWTFPAFILILSALTVLSAKAGYRFASALGAASTLLLGLWAGAGAMLAATVGALIDSRINPQGDAVSGALVGSAVAFGLELAAALVFLRLAAA